MRTPSRGHALTLVWDRYLAGMTDTVGSTKVGIVGASVPVEIVLAAGLLPVRISGRPRDTPQANAYGLDDLDGPARAAFEQLIAEDGHFDFALIAPDVTAHSVLFQTLREIQRVEPVPSLPRFGFVDVLHLPYRTTSRYNRGQLAQMVQTVEEWSGESVSVDRLRSAIETVNATRSLLADVMALRRSRPARLAGVDALAIVGAALLSPALELHAWLSELLAESETLDELTGIRVYLNGSTHEDAAVYELIESCGCVIVGEDHPRGEDAFGPMVSAHGDPLDSLAEHYQFANLPARRSASERAQHVVRRALESGADVVVTYTVVHDEATPWDAPAIIAAASATGLPIVALPEQRYDEPDLSELASVLERALDAQGTRR
jgi:benzoyl-CoA reductase/2-hydroxyglutaryl-CoA dehydratase subunit BcrC/BadD/HgdB